MKGPVVALFLLIAQLLSAQPPLQWQRCLGGSATEDLRRVRVMPAGGYAAVGWTSSVDGDVVGQHGDRDLWVVRLDE
ncbi:MAG: hypothetical protein KDB88_14120, partial [Flavobacteriales bacterium]|nr:hypothetical protein [Flavobacteriales bacterium]